MWAAIAGVTAPIVVSIVGVSWRLATRLGRIEESLKGPNDATLALGRQEGYVWVLDSRGAGHWLTERSVPDLP